jgi:NAD(P)H-hydrate epimerase
MPGDSAADEKDAVIKAANTLTFGVVKPAFVLDRNTAFTGTWHLLDIGLDEEFIRSCPAQWFLLEPADITGMLPRRDMAAHKGNFGHALLIAGSYGKAGAAILAARACMRSGTGLVTVRTPALCVNAIQSSVPEVMVSPDPGPSMLNEGFDTTSYSAIGIGPGIGNDAQTGNVLKRAIQDFGGPMVLDADALNLLAQNRTWLSFLPQGSLLTPHPGEFARLAGKMEDPLERIRVQQEWSKRYGIYILLKGRDSALSCPACSRSRSSTARRSVTSLCEPDTLTALPLASITKSQGCLYSISRIPHVRCSASLPPKAFDPSKPGLTTNRAPASRARCSSRLRGLSE